AGQRAIAGPAVEERLRSPRAPQTLAKRRGGRGLDARLARGVRRQHDAVVFTRRARADLALEHVERHQLGLALERIAPTTAARRLHAHERAGGNGLVVHETGKHALVRAAGVDRHAERRARLAAAQAPAGEDRAIGDAQERGVAQDAKLLQVAEPSTAVARAAWGGGKREALDAERKARLAELGGQVLAVGHDVDRVGAVGIPASARAPAEHLAHQVELALVVEAMETRVADGFLI